MDDEEEIEELLESVQNKDEKAKNSIKKLSTLLSFVLSNNIFIHFIVTLLVNILVISMLIGFFDTVLLKIDNFINVIYIVLLFTTFESIFKLFIIKVIPTLMVYSIGSIFFLFHFLWFYLIDMILKEFEFKNAICLIGFSFMFSFFRYIFVVSSKKFINNIISRRSSI